MTGIEPLIEMFVGFIREHVPLTKVLVRITVYLYLAQLAIGAVHRLNMELNLQSLFGLLCTAVLTG